MINLLPPDTKQTLRYARRNRVLLRWVVATACCLAGGLVLMAGGWLYLNQAINQTNQQISDTKSQLQAQHVAEIQKQVTDTSNNLKLVVKVLSKEILFSKLLTQLGTVVPSNVILTGITITQTQGSIGITAQASDYAAAAQLQANLADPNNRIFSKADTESITCSSGAQATKYPCTVNIKALFASDNPFLFINDQKGAS